MSLATVTLDDKYARESGRVYLTGTQALVRLAIMQRQRDAAAGLDTAGFISGYRGSPLGGFDVELWRARPFLRDNHIHFQPGVNEDLAATSAWGSQQVNLFPGGRHDGVFAMWYGKGPGVDRSGDAFKHGNNAGTAPHGGVLALAGDDHTCKSSTLAHQSDYAFVDAMMPLLNPAGVQDFIDLGLMGFALSRFAGTWVGFKLVAELLESAATVSIDAARRDIVTPTDFAMPEGGLNIRWPDAPVAQEARLHRHKMAAALAFARANAINRVVIDSPRPRLGIAAAGKSYLDLRQALDLLGIDAAMAAEMGLRVYKIGMTWPLEPAGVGQFADGLEEILVVEEKRPLIEGQIKEILYHRDGPRVIGKTDVDGTPLLPTHFEISAAEIAQLLAARISRHHDGAAFRNRLGRLKAVGGDAPPPIVRTPYFCSGCPHNISTRVPEGSWALGGIGCHTMAMWMDRGNIAYTQMGGEGASWIGQAPFTETRHVFQNLGDGTYFHSGLLAIRAAVAAGVNITYKILYNDAVAMTGGQPADGPLDPPIITRQLAAEGVTRIVVVTDEPGKYPVGAGFAGGVAIEHRDHLDRVQRDLRQWPGVSAIVYDQTCAAEKRRRRKRGTFPDPARRVFINSAVCEGCGDCGTASNCLSVVPVDTEFGRKRAIDQSSCNKDMSCLKGFCPALVTVEGGVPRRPRIEQVDDQGLGALPDPALPALDGAHGILVCGVGGTGVVTIGALLGMAAHIEGKAATVHDMTGLAQKGGAVYSHIRIAASSEALNAVRIPATGAQLLLGCDLVVAASPEALSRTVAGVTRAVVNSHETQTGAFTRDPDLAFPGAGLRRLIEEATGAEGASFVEASRLAAALVGDSIAANMIMLGHAWQKGAIPLGEAAIRRAIELNGVAVAGNLRSFAWGRRAAHQPQAVAALAARHGAAHGDQPAAATLDELVARRVASLTAYQDRAYARRYGDLVAAVRAAERAKAPGMEGLAEAVARNAHKLMAYKDEYEVARLFTDGRFRHELEAQFEGGYRLRFHMAPPLVAPRDAASGRQRKMTFGGWMHRALRPLARLKGLRGTWFDPFGHTHERRAERRLVGAYETTVATLIAGLDHDNHALAVEIASIPAHIRGFGHVKAGNMAKARLREAELLAAYRTPAEAPSAAE